MFDESYDKRKLSEIFSQMKFFNVVSIQVTYGYEKILIDYDYDCYVEKKSKRFYLLNKYHYSYSIDTVIKFIIDDTVAECHHKRDKLQKYYKKLLGAYAKNQLEQNIVNDRDSLKPIWIIDIDNGDESNNGEDAVKLEENINDQDSDTDIVLDSALADKILNEEKILIPKSKQKTSSQSTNTSNLDTNINSTTSKSTGQSSTSSDDQLRNNQENEHHRKDTTSTFIPKKQNIVKFQHIDLPDLEISDENVLVENSNKSVDEEILKRIGRTGERWAYEYLKNSYRTKDNVSVKWLNETFETGSPYDIEIKFIDNSQDTQRIEVKTTTKHYDNYQFSISIQEVEEILLNPNTYYIYRINLSTRSLIIIDNIKQNLSDKRQLQLQMNVLKLEDFNET
ncbi:unnamed protein product [Rotaria sp. Silwood2]|nr:unnamed protein product [Rotaria sp. Silwood2]CAF4165776.1 unnamed protein product [Rotaria sp. Silwood2]